jgi:hypothetical protein
MAAGRACALVPSEAREPYQSKKSSLSCIKFISAHALSSSKKNAFDLSDNILYIVDNIFPQHSRGNTVLTKGAAYE